jgi:signal transduction histidine kinase
MTIRILSTIAAVFFVASFACAASLAAEPKRVMVLHSFGRDFKPWSEYAKAIRAELDRQSSWPLDIIEYSLVTARFSDDSEAPFVDYLRAVFAKHPLDLIVSIGAPAASFVQQHRQQLFATTPMVFMAVDQRRVQSSDLTASDTAVAVRINYLSAFENILQVLPDTKDVIVVVGTSPIEKFWKDAIGKEVEPLANRIKLSWTDELSFEALLKQASALPQHTVIFWELMIVDAAGVVHEGAAPLTKLHAVANAPIFSYDESFFGSGIVGGPLLLVADSSRQAAAVAVRVLGGEKPGEITTPPVQFGSPVFDWREMQRWGISESSLPAGSEIMFREPTVWQRYSWQIALITAVLLVQAGLISGLLHQRSRRRLAEVQSQQRMAELARVIRFSTAGELTGSIAHEINQPLTCILANAETADAILKSPTPDIAELKDIVKDILQDDRRASEVIRRMRSLLTKKPFELKSLDLNDVVRETADFFSTLAVGRKVELTSSIIPTALPILGDRIQLQQVILNLVVNGIDAMKDTPAKNRIIRIRTSRAEKFAELSVSDRGPGIPEDKQKEVFEPFFTSKAEGMGMGLSIARTIVEAHNGLLWAQNRDHGGASFRIRLPLDEEAVLSKELSVAQAAMLNTT